MTLMNRFKLTNKDGVIRGHLPCEILGVAKLLLDRGAEMTAIIILINHRRSPLVLLFFSSHYLEGFLHVKYLSTLSKKKQPTFLLNWYGKKITFILINTAKKQHDFTSHQRVPHKITIQFR